MTKTRMDINNVIRELDMELRREKAVRDETEIDRIVDHCVAQLSTYQKENGELSETMLKMMLKMMAVKVRNF